MCIFDVGLLNFIFVIGNEIGGCGVDVVFVNEVDVVVLVFLVMFGDFGVFIDFRSSEFIGSISFLFGKKNVFIVCVIMDSVVQVKFYIIKSLF